MFIFGALLEFAVVTYMASRDFVKSGQSLIFVQMLIDDIEEQKGRGTPPPELMGSFMPTTSPRIVSTPLISTSESVSC